MRGVCAELWIQWSLKQTAGPAVSLCLRGAAGEWLYSPPRAQTAGGREFLGILQFPEDSTSTTYLSGTFLEFNSSHKNTIMRTPVSMFHYLKAWIKLAARIQSACLFCSGCFACFPEQYGLVLSTFVDHAWIRLMLKHVLIHVSAFLRAKRKKKKAEQSKSGVSAHKSEWFHKSFDFINLTKYFCII